MLHSWLVHMVEWGPDGGLAVGGCMAGIAPSQL